MGVIYMDTDLRKQFKSYLLTVYREMIEELREQIKNMKKKQEEGYTYNINDIIKGQAKIEDYLEKIEDII